MLSLITSNLHSWHRCLQPQADYVQGQCDHGLEDYNKRKRRETRKDSIIKLRKLPTRKYATRKTKPIKLNKRASVSATKMEPK